jgi:hypothetical protein
MTDTQLTPSTVAGALRAYIIAALPELPAYKNTAPANTTPPVAVIFDGIAASTRTHGSDIIVDETVQVDLYTVTGQSLNLGDQLHAVLHQAPLWIPGSQIHRVSVTGRQTDQATDDDENITRQMFTVMVTRRFMSANDPNHQPPQRQPWPAGIATTEKGAPNGVATLDGSGHVPSVQIPALPYDAEGAAAQALTDAHTYTDQALANIVLPSDVETTTGAQAKANAAEAAAIQAANAYTDNAVSNIHVDQLNLDGGNPTSNYGTITNIDAGGIL